MATTPAGTRLQVATDVNFTALVKNYDGAYATGINTTAGELPKGVTLYCRGAHKESSLGWSAWSQVVSFMIAGIPTTPTVSVSVNIATGAVTLTSSAFSAIGTTHAATTYQIATDTEFAAKVVDNKDNTNLLSYQIPTNTLVAGTQYYARICHTSLAETNSFWSTVVMFTIALPGSQRYTTPGTFIFTVPDGVTSINIAVIGGGGGGAGGNFTVYDPHNGIPTAGTGGLSSILDLIAYGGLGGGSWSGGIGGTGTGGDGGDGGNGASYAYDRYGPGWGGSSGNWNSKGTTGGDGWNNMPVNPTSFGNIGRGGQSNDRDNITSGGGGGGGGLRWRNNVAVTPGQQISLTVGAPGAASVGASGDSGSPGQAGCVEIRWGLNNGYPR